MSGSDSKAPASADAAGTAPAGTVSSEQAKTSAGASAADKGEKPSGAGDAAGAKTEAAGAKKTEDVGDASKTEAAEAKKAADAGDAGKTEAAGAKKATAAGDASKTEAAGAKKASDAGDAGKTEATGVKKAADAGDASKSEATGATKTADAGDASKTEATGAKKAPDAGDASKTEAAGAKIAADASDACKTEAAGGKKAADAGDAGKAEAAGGKKSADAGDAKDKEEKKETPKDKDEKKETPKDKEEKKETPKDKDEKKETPKDKEEKKEAPKDKDEKKEAPKEKDEKKEAPKDKEDKKEAPKDKDEKKEATKDKDEKKEASKDKDEKKEAPKDKEEKKEATKDKDEKKEAPKDKDEKKETPKGKEDKRDTPKDKDEKTETPKDTDGKKDMPKGKEDKKETPKEEKEKKESPKEQLPPRDLKEAPKTQTEPPARKAPVEYVPDEAALKSELGALAKKCELDDGLIEFIVHQTGLKTVGCLAEMDALREFTLEVLDADYIPPGEADPRELYPNEVQQIKMLYEACRREGGLPPGPFCNRMQRFYDDSIQEFRECLDSFSIPKPFQVKLFEDGVENKSRLAKVHGATFGTVILGLRFAENEGEEPRGLTKAEQLNMRKCWEAVRQESGMPIERGSETRPSAIKTMFNHKVLVNEFGESLERCGRTFKQIAESFNVDPKLLEVLTTAGFDGKSKLARLQVPGEFKVHVLSLKYDHGDGTRTPLTVDDKDKLIHLLNECRKEAGFPEFHGLTPPHSPAPNKMRTLSIKEEDLTHKPPSHIPVTQQWLDLARTAEANKIHPNVLRGLAQLNYDTKGKIAAIMVPAELDIAVLKAHFDDGSGHYVQFTEDEKQQVLKLHEVCRQDAKIPHHGKEGDHMGSMGFVKGESVGIGKHLPTHVTGAWEHDIHELMVATGIPDALQKMLLGYGFNTPIECAPECFKVQMTRFQYDPEGNFKYRLLKEDEKEMLLKLHDKCREDLGWPIHHRIDLEGELQRLQRLVEDPVLPKDDQEVFQKKAEKCGLPPELTEAILALGFNTATKVAKLEVPGEFKVQLLSLVYQPKGEKVARKLTEDEKQLVKHLCGKCRMLVGLPSRRDFLPPESLCVIEHMEKCNVPEKLRVALQKAGVSDMAAAENFHKAGKIATIKYDPGDGGGERLLNEREKRQVENFCARVEFDHTHTLEHAKSVVQRHDAKEDAHIHEVAAVCEIPDELLEAIHGIGLHSVHDVAKLSFPEFNMFLMQMFYHPKGEKARRRVNKEEKHNLRMFYAECREDFGLPCRRGYLPLLEGKGACWRPLPEILASKGIDEQMEPALMHEGIVDTKAAAEFSADEEKCQQFLKTFKYDPTNGAHPGKGLRLLTAEERKQLESVFEMCKLEAVYHECPSKGIEERAAKMESTKRSVRSIGQHVGVNTDLQDAINQNGLRIYDIGKMLPAEFKVHLLGIKYRPQGEKYLRPLNQAEKKQLTNFYNEARKDVGMPSRRESTFLGPTVHVERAPPGARGLQTRTLHEIADEHGVPKALMSELQDLNLHNTREFGQLRQPNQLEAVVHGLKYAPAEGAEKRKVHEKEIMKLKFVYEDCRKELLMPSGLYNEAHLQFEIPSPMSPKRAWGPDTDWGELSTTAGSLYPDEDRGHRHRHHHSSHKEKKLSKHREDHKHGHHGHQRNTKDSTPMTRVPSRMTRAPSNRARPTGAPKLASGALTVDVGANRRSTASDRARQSNRASTFGKADAGARMSKVALPGGTRNVQARLTARMSKAEALIK